MLFSEIKERKNRFFLSLKITLPFIFFLLFLFIIIINDINVKLLIFNNIIAFLIIFFLYFFYILYQINMVFKTTVIEPITKAFSRKYMLEIINKKMKNEKFLLVGIKIDNIIDINERYGIKKTDNFLKKFINKLDNFLKSNGYKNNIIGNIIGGNFSFLIKCDDKKINHLMNMFIIQQENHPIDNILVKIKFSYIQSNSEDNAKDLLTSLFEHLKFDDIEKRKKKRLNIKVDEFEKLVINLIENRKFDFRFQKINNIKTNKCEIIEVLVTLYSQKYGKITKKQFISVVNRIGYEILFDEILIEEICKIFLEIKKDIKLSIKISSNSLKNNRFIHNIQSLCKKYQLDNSKIIFEISGSNCQNDIKRLNENIQILRKLGFLISIDNFGANDTSCNYIKNLDYDIVKFDIDWTKKYQNEKIKNIIKGFILIFQKLNIKTVVKFVEDKKSFNFFKNIGVDFIEGYVIDKPKTLKQIKEMR